jgi:SSS family solute:Na+ symporter
MFYPYIGSPVNAGAIAMVAGLIVVPVVSLISPKMDSKKVDEIFSCMDETVVVHRRTALPEQDESI